MKLKMPEKPKISRRTVTALVFAATVTLLVALVILSIFMIQRVREFRIVGETRYSESFLSEASGIELGEGLFSIDSAAAEERILEKAPRLKSVKVRPGFFSAVVIEVVEEKAEYYSYINGDYYLLSADLRILERSKSSDSYAKEAVKLSMIGGNITSAIEGDHIEFSSEKAKEELEAFIAKIKSMNFGDYGVTALGFEDNVWRDAYIVLDGRLKIILGDPDSIDEKITVALQCVASSEKNYEYAEVLVSDMSEVSYRKVDFIE